MYPMACTDLNVSQDCVDVAALETARGACVAEEPVETPKLCSLTDQEKLMGTLEIHQFTAQELGDAHDNAYAMV